MNLGIKGMPRVEESNSEELLEVVSNAIDAHKADFEEERGRLADTLRGRALLVVDSAFGVPTMSLQSRLKHVAVLKSQPEVAELVLEKLFDGRVPRSTTEVFGRFFGPNVELVHHDIKYRQGDVSGKIAGVVFTGSPADVAFDGKSEKLSKRSRLCHRDVFERLRVFHDLCVKEGIPVLAFCFGMQFIAKLLGGEVREMVRNRFGEAVVTVTESGDEVLKDLFDRSMGVGETYVSHSQQALLNPMASLEIMRLRGDVGEGAWEDMDEHDREKATVSHGSLNINPDDGKFNLDLADNAGLIRELMEDGRYVSLALQSHPELTFPHMLLRNLVAAVSLDRYAQIVQRMAFVKELLALMTDFLGMHRRVRRRK